MNNPKYGDIKDLRMIHAPAIYKHFKDKYYATMGVSTPITSEKLLNYKDKLGLELSCELEHMEVWHTELEDYFLVFKVNNEWRHIDKTCMDNLVLYKSLYDNHSAYARPEGMFLSVVDKNKYPDVKQEYRFELVKY